MKHGQKYSDAWYPLYIDRWIFGSTRHELIVQDERGFRDLRGIWLDLLSLCQKDGGYIRANEVTPYPLAQLAGMFGVPLEELEEAINICLQVGKLKKVSKGIYYVSSFEEYSLSRSGRYKAKRRAEERGQSEHDRSRGEQNCPPSNPNCPPGGHERIPIREENRKEKKRESPTDSRAPAPDKPKQLFDLWNQSVTPPIPKAKDLNPGRRAKFNRYLKIPGWEEAFREGVAKVVKSDFCRKKVPTNKCPSGWVITLDFLLANDTNAFKAAEGQYDHQSVPEKTAPRLKTAEEYFAEEGWDDAKTED